MAAIDVTTNYVRNWLPTAPGRFSITQAMRAILVASVTVLCISTVIGAVCTFALRANHPSHDLWKFDRWAPFEHLRRL
jgi:hypothetical protein